MRTAVASFALVAALVGGTAGTAAPASGVRGTVLRSPVTPVCREGVACSAPAAGIALVFMRHDVVAGRVTSGRDGTFRLALPPGSYGVRLARTPRLGSLRPQSVVVRSGRFTTLKLEIDTGIRSVSRDRSVALRITRRA
jgi:hypothetical protein